jgi:hypothetical protein
VSTSRSTDPHAMREVVLDQLPATTFQAGVTYLADVLRECQLVLVGSDQGSNPAPEVLALAEGLVPDLEEIGDLFEAGDLAAVDATTVRFRADAQVGQVGLLAHLQMQMVQLRLIGRRGNLMVRSDPQVTQLLAWMWDEAADQLHGRPPRPYRPIV